MFGKRREYRKLADHIGKAVHAQLHQVLQKRPEIRWTPYEMAFTSGYLNSLTFVGFSRIGCRDIEIQRKYIKHLCNGVLPNRLWEVFQKGVALNEVSQGGEREEFVKTRECYELGSKAGIHDAGEYLYDGIAPKNLANFLSGDPVQGADF